MKVGYLGPQGTFSYEACNDIYSEDIEKVPFRTIKETILALKDNRVNQVVVPIENSIQGCVTETLDTLIENEEIMIYEESILTIQQNLLAQKRYHFDEIQEIYSHPQALAQCRNYIEAYLKNANIIEVPSTALAAQKVTTKEYAACICNMECKKEYHLELLQDNIQDNNFNKTKFWILGKKKERNDGNENKMTMVFTTKNKPGALYNALRIFDKNHLNLTKIESRPAKTRLGEYYFLIDIEIEDKNYRNAIKELQKVVGYYRILGKYKKVGE